MSRVRNAVLSTPMMAGALPTSSITGSGQDDVSVMGVGDATTIRFDPTWIRFRPNPWNGEHLNNSSPRYCSA